jgi:hypothetical protein
MQSHVPALFPKSCLNLSIHLVSKRSPSIQDLPYPNKYILGSPPMCVWVSEMFISSLWEIVSYNPLTANAGMLRRDARNGNIAKMSGEAIAGASSVLLLFVRNVLTSPPNFSREMDTCIIKRRLGPTTAIMAVMSELTYNSLIF